MEITSFGLVFLLICFICFFKPVKYLLYIVIISCVFQAAAVLNLYGKGIPPCVLAEFLFIIKVLWKDSWRIVFRSSLLKILLVFVLYSATVSLIMPFVFNGIKVIVPGETTDSDLAMGEIMGHLKFSIRNVIQVIYLIVNSLTIYCISRVYHEITEAQTFGIFFNAIKIVLLIGFWEFIAKVSGTYYFPDTFFYSNIGYVQYWLQGARMNSTFTEPSYAGAFLSAALCGIIYLGKKRGLLILVAIAFLLNLSGTGLASFLLVIVCSFFFYPRRMYKYILWGVLLYLLAHLINYDNLVLEMLMSKGESSSGLARTGAVRYTLSLIANTYFMGVGLGSHRCFSFLTGLIAAIGISGLLLFLYFVWKLVRPVLYSNSQREGRSIVVFAGSLFVAQCLAIPDFSFPIMWMWIYLLTILHYKLSAPRVCS